VAILGLSISTFGTGSAVSAGLGVIAHAFPEAKEIYIQMLVSLPAIALVPASLYAGLLASRVGKKKMAIFGTAIYLVGGVGAGFANTIEGMLLFRLIIGVGAGILLPLPLSLIADFYSGKQRAKLTGYTTGVASLGGVLMTVGAGWLAGIHWRLVYAVYLVMLPVLMMSLFWLEAPVKKPEKVVFHYNRDVAIVGWYLFSITIVLFSLPLFMAMHLEQLALGGSVAASVVLIMPNLAGILIGGQFVRIKSYFKLQTGPLGLLFLSLGFFLMSTGMSVWLIALGALSFGVGIGVINPINYLRLVNAVQKEDAPFGVAIVNALMSFGQFVAPLFYSLLRGLSLVDTISSIYFFNAMLVLFLAVYFGIRRRFFTSPSHLDKEVR